MSHLVPPQVYSSLIHSHAFEPHIAPYSTTRGHAQRLFNWDHKNIVAICSDDNGNVFDTSKVECGLCGQGRRRPAAAKKASRVLCVYGMDIHLVLTD